MAPPGVLRGQAGIGEPALRVVVPPGHPGMRRRGIQVPPVLLGVLAVVTLRSGQPEDPFLDDRVAAVPQAQSEAEDLPRVAQAGQAILVPPVGTRSRMIMRAVVPCRTVFAVVLTDSSPGPLGQVRPPRAPVLLARVRRDNPARLGGVVQRRRMRCHAPLYPESRHRYARMC